MIYADKRFDCWYNENNDFNEGVPANIKNDIRNIYKQYGENTDEKTIDEIYSVIKQTVKEEFLKEKEQTAEKVIDIAVSAAKKEIDKRINKSN